MDNKERLGRAAFHGYYDNPVMDWTDVPDYQKMHWIRAAEEVLKTNRKLTEEALLKVQEAARDEMLKDRPAPSPTSPEPRYHVGEEREPGYSYIHHDHYGELNARARMEIRDAVRVAVKQAFAEERGL